MLLCTLGIYLFFAQIWSIHLASEHLDHLVTHTVAVFNDFTTSVSVSSFQFCLNCFPKYQVNHQFPHPPLSFCSSADTRWWRRQWYTSMHWEKATFNSDLTVLIHVAWPLLRYVSKLRPCKKKKKNLAQVWFGFLIRFFCPHSSEKNLIEEVTLLQKTELQETKKP